MGATQSRRLQPNLRIVCYTCAAVVVAVACTASGNISPSSGPTLSSLQPMAGPVGTPVTITGTGFDERVNTINFGASAFPNIPSPNGTTITFVIPTATNPPCRNATPPCAIVTALITPGSYDLSVINAQGSSNSMTFTVTKS